jgi:hypothetical protein
LAKAKGITGDSDGGIGQANSGMKLYSKISHQAQQGGKGIEDLESCSRGKYQTFDGCCGIDHIVAGLHARAEGFDHCRDCIEEQKIVGMVAISRSQTRQQSRVTWVGLQMQT